MKRQVRLLERMILGAQLPAEGLPGQPLVEIVGQCRVLVENHQGVTVYGCKEIRIKVRFGQVIICGENLELANMTKQQLVIVGRIDSATLQRGNSR